VNLSAKTEYACIAVLELAARAKQGEGQEMYYI